MAATRALHTWLPGLLLIFAFLGHDTLMAAQGALAAPAPPAHQHDAISAHEASAAPADAGLPEHPADCGPTVTLALASGHRLDLAGADAAGMPTNDARSFPLRVETRHSAEPGSPPGTRRAWLQVYRL